jgi:hypothetical protein
MSLLKVRNELVTKEPSRRIAVQTSDSLRTSVDADGDSNDGFQIGLAVGGELDGGGSFASLFVDGHGSPPGNDVVEGGEDRLGEDCDWE